MTLQEMIFEFELMLETTSPVLAVADRPDTQTMVEFLNMAQLRFLRDRYLQGPTVQDNVTRLLVAADDLHSLVTIANFSDFDLMGTCKEFIIPDNFLHYIRSNTRMSRTGFAAHDLEWVDNTVGSYDVVDSIMVTPYNSPTLLHPVVVMYRKDRLALYVDSQTTVSHLSVTYLRKPADFEVSDITQECELAHYMCNELVRLAFEMFLMEYKLRLRQKTDDSKGDAT